MRWELSEEQQLFRDSLRDWLENVATPEAVGKWQDSGQDAEFERKLIMDGWFGVGTAEELGGQGGGLLELALTAEQLGRCAAPSGAWLASVLAVPALAGAHADVARAVLEDGEFAALAVRADRAPDRPGAVRVAPDGSLSGAVTAVLGADRAHWLVVPADSDGGLGLYLVDATTAGVQLRPRRLLDRSRSGADVTLDGVTALQLNVGADEVLAHAALRAAVLVAADSLGATDRMLALAVEYSKQRHQFGAPIGSFQAVKHAAATMLVTVESSRSVAYFAAASVDEGLADSTMHAAAAKAQVTDGGVHAADSALTVHGAIGYTWEHPLHLLYKRTKLDQSLFGSPVQWNERIAEALRLAG